MKKIILFLLIISTITVVNAQNLIPIKFGLKAGVNIANISSTPNEGVKNVDNRMLIGATGGLYMEVAINDKWYINPEVLYTQKGASFDYNFIHDDANNRDEHSTKNNLKLGYIELNTTMSYKTSCNIALNFGPSLAYLIQSDYITNEENTAPESLEDPTEHEILETSNYLEESLDLGFNIGISYYLSEYFLINTQINTGFLKIGEVSQQIYTGDTVDQSRSNIFELKNRGIVVSFAYLF